MEFAYFNLVEKTFYITAELSLWDDIVISCAFVLEDVYLHRQTSSLINIRREGENVLKYYCNTNF